MWAKVAVLILMAAALISVGSAQTSTPSKTKEIDIPYTRFVLNNGLTVIVHEEP